MTGGGMVGWSAWPSSSDAGAEQADSRRPRQEDAQREAGSSQSMGELEREGGSQCPGTLVLEAQAWSRGLWEMGSWRKGVRPRAQPRAASCGLAHSSARPAGTLRTHNSISSKGRISSELYLKVMFPGGGNYLQKGTGLCLLRPELSFRR